MLYLPGIQLSCLNEEQDSSVEVHKAEHRDPSMREDSSSHQRVD